MDILHIGVITNVPVDGETYNDGLKSTFNRSRKASFLNTNF